MDSFLDKFIRWLRYRKIVKHIPRDSIVCDIGCGREAEFLKNTSVFIKKGIGLDQKVNNFANSKLELKEIRIEKNLPLENESCDVVTLMAVLEHLTFPQEILRECWRILKKEGKLILTTPTPNARPILDFLAFKLNLIDKEAIAEHKNYFQPKEVKEMLFKAGFSQDRISSYFFEFRFNSLFIAQK